MKSYSFHIRSTLFTSITLCIVIAITMTIDLLVTYQKSYDKAIESISPKIEIGKEKSCKELEKRGK